MVPCPHCGTQLFGSGTTTCYKCGKPVHVDDQTDAERARAIQVAKEKEQFVRKSLLWANFLHPWTKQGFLEGRCFVEDGTDFVSGARGWTEYAQFNRLRKSAVKCSRCKKNIVAFKYSHNPQEMPGCAKCLQCHEIFCNRCWGKETVSGGMVYAPRDDLSVTLASCPSCKRVLQTILWGES